MDKDKKLFYYSILGVFIFLAGVGLACILFEGVEFSFKYYAGVFTGWAIFAGVHLRFIPTKK